MGTLAVPIKITTMTKEEYKRSNHYNLLLNSIKDAIEEKCKIQNDDSLSDDEKAEAIAKVSDKIMKKLREEYIRIPYAL